jgi:hypothetical protein
MSGLRRPRLCRRGRRCRPVCSNRSTRTPPTSRHAVAERQVDHRVGAAVVCSAAVEVGRARLLAQLEARTDVLRRSSCSGAARGRAPGVSGMNRKRRDEKSRSRRVYCGPTLTMVGRPRQFVKTGAPVWRPTSRASSSRSLNIRKPLCDSSASRNGAESPRRASRGCRARRGSNGEGERASRTGCSTAAARSARPVSWPMRRLSSCHSRRVLRRLRPASR